MESAQTARSLPLWRRPIPGRLAQGVAVGVCLLVALAMILNTEMSGEAVWFWYATFFHHGARLYADLHLPLQPLFVLETDFWVNLLGIRAWAYQIPAILHALLLCFSVGLVLRECRWPRSAKAPLLAMAFVITVVGNSYRLDDYHVLSESFIFCGIGLLLRLSRTESATEQMSLALLTGVVSGLSTATRLNDGTAMAVTAAFCALFLARRNRILCSVVLLGTAVLTLLFVSHLTGDHLHDYVSNSVIRAMGSKGGTGSFASAPIKLVANAFKTLFHQRKRVLGFLVLLFLGTHAAARRWRMGPAPLAAVRVVLIVLTLALCGRQYRTDTLHGRLLDVLMLVCILATYILGPVVMARWALARRNHRKWDVREILLLIPLAEWASSSASSSAEPLTQYYAPVAMFLLLLAVLVPLERIPRALRIEISAWVLVVIAVGIVNKAWVPYSWQNWVYPPMFKDRVWYRHPVYGPLYIEREQLAFNLASCAEIDGAHSLGTTQPTLLSLPYPYPNYFCATPPWHGYIQTFFDTTQRSTIETLMHELDTAPPEWIIYQRQMLILTGAERLYNHNHALAQRDLDTMIFQKIRSGQWRLVDRRDYLPGDGWFIVHTHPDETDPAPGSIPLVRAATDGSDVRPVSR